MYKQLATYHENERFHSKIVKLWTFLRLTEIAAFKKCSFSSHDHKWTKQSLFVLLKDSVVTFDLFESSYE